MSDRRKGALPLGQSVCWRLLWHRRLCRAYQEVLQRDQKDIATLLHAPSGIHNLLPGTVLQVHCLPADLCVQGGRSERRLQRLDTAHPCTGKYLSSNRTGGVAQKQICTKR